MSSEVRILAGLALPATIDLDQRSKLKPAVKLKRGCPIGAMPRPSFAQAHFQNEVVLRYSRSCRGYDMAEQGVQKSWWRGWLTKGIIGVFFAGVLLTALLFVGFDVVAHNTKSNEFCMSCHTMQNNFAEYQGTTAWACRRDAPTATSPKAASRCWPTSFVPQAMSSTT